MSQKRRRGPSRGERIAQGVSSHAVDRDSENTCAIERLAASVSPSPRQSAESVRDLAASMVGRSLLLLRTASDSTQQLDRFLAIVDRSLFSAEHKQALGDRLRSEAERSLLVHEVLTAHLSQDDATVREALASKLDVLWDVLIEPPSSAQETDVASQGSVLAGAEALINQLGGEPLGAVCVSLQQSSFLFVDDEEEELSGASELFGD